MKTMKKTALILSALGFVFITSSCNTIKYIPEDKTAAQIIQMGQNAASTASYKSAIYCYETVIERYGTSGSIYVEAKYEIGNVYLKQKKYDKAYQVFKELQEIYDSTGPYLPPAYKKLAEIGMEKIPEKYKN